VTDVPAPLPVVTENAVAAGPAGAASAADPAASSGAGGAASSTWVPALIAAAPSTSGRWIAAGAAVLAAITAAALVLALNTQQRLKSLEAELVKRQQDTGSQATEARTLARAAEGSTRDVAAKMALLEARVAETVMQRTQLEELIQSLARSRDENVLADLDAAVRVAQQQAAITGSAEPLILTLKQADERLARFNQPRLERVRRAVALDLDKTRSAGVTDITVLTIRLDEIIRQIDELPLLAAPERRAARANAGDAAPLSAANPAANSAANASANASALAVAAAAAASAAAVPWSSQLRDRWGDITGTVWREVKSLVRVTRIDQPEAMLVAPEQAFFLRENVKLRLLNARLALLSRQFDTAQSDLRDAQAAMDRYFDRSVKRTTVVIDQLRQVTAQARLVSVPRPDATLAAIATAAAGR
jgi:uroporphyrin-III C-methyltransferase